MFTKRFFPWIVLFFGLLILIPILMKSGNIKGAKLLGVLVVVGVSVALNIWRIQTRKRNERHKRVKMNLNDRYWLRSHIHFYNTLSRAERKIFEDRIGLFLTDIRISEIGAEEVEKDICLYVASSAVIAFWGLPHWNYGELHEVIVYPEDYNENMQFNTSGTIQGQIHHGGLMDKTMILSKRALIHGFSNTTDKKNLGIHEFAHLLDKEDGVLDGVPVGMEKDTSAAWCDLMGVELKKIRAEKSDINPYGGTNQAEFFAVVVEYYKENPKVLHLKHPKVYDVLHHYFNPA